MSKLMADIPMMLLYFGPLFLYFTTKFSFFKGFYAAAVATATAVVAVITTALTLTGCGASLNYSCHVLINRHRST